MQAIYSVEASIFCFTLPPVGKWDHVEVLII